MQEIRAIRPRSRLFAQITPVVVEDVFALLRPLKEGRAPTDADWAFARKQLDDENAALRAG
ncbi:hypothetical protein AA23498_3323 [Acetobacter nitrogenifigens DSM 23921 = NBRC 105050]|uniref:Uncharacterized protein n=1 Tax=Acetobacter nitrogenifigens DSM 23921 = NBRC 105050 TaxID=1120919 RepID=A0A511X6S7_9PROT|nr:hypothetical protein AA23498_3323 [Acetobacter nitrogenifigens DSM 23921 = NBRC 105050]GEN58642.1 hypothetical protein ANI02nite_05260 [Acetobacter nitrogenifigens DSM 23921 = NBRC 105050]